MIIIIHDLFMAATAWQLSWLIRFNFELVSYPDWKLSFNSLPMIILIQGLVSFRFGLYRGLWRFASLPDLWNIFRASILGVLCITLVLFISIRLEGIPRSILVLYPVFLIFLLGGPRLAYRFWKDNSFKLNSAATGQKVLIVADSHSQPFSLTVIPNRGLIMSSRYEVRDLVFECRSRERSLVFSRDDGRMGFETMFHARHKHGMTTTYRYPLHAR